jgi:hypothetical protein
LIIDAIDARHFHFHYCATLFSFSSIDVAITFLYADTPLAIDDISAIIAAIFAISILLFSPCAINTPFHFILLLCRHFRSTFHFAAPPSPYASPPRHIAYASAEARQHY